MGTYTPEKDEYDRLTKDYFAARGYVAEIISGAGFSDVVAWHPQKKELAIIEVKSPKENDASPTFTTEYNAANMSRDQVLSLIKPTPIFKKNSGLARLYAFVISSQLYTYCRKAEAHAKAFAKKQPTILISTMENISAGLAVPAENSSVLVEILKILQSGKVIRSSKSEVSCRLAVCRIDY